MSDKFRAWLSEELDQRGWSQSELARRAGVSQFAVSSVISGNRNPGADYRAEHCRADGSGGRLPILQDHRA